jgi:hypothetical protein
MALCCYYAVYLYNDQEICPVHLYSAGIKKEWSVNNRVMCGILNRGESWPPRLTADQREDVDFSEHFGSLDESPLREAPDSPVTASQRVLDEYASQE